MMMNRIVAVLACLPAAFLISCCDEESLLAEFQNPPQEARPYVWWHWMDGNVSREGIRADLEWMHRIGIAGFHQFDAGGVDMPRAAEVKYDYLSEGWKEMFRYALDKADSLGMDVTIASAPGWSSTGGRWVTPEDAMKKLEWVSVESSGGDIVVKLPPLRKVTGTYQDIEQSNDRLEVDPYGYDVAVIAVKLPEGEKNMEGEVRNDSLITFRSDSPFTARSITVKSGRTEQRALGLDYKCSNRLESSCDGINWKTVKELLPSELPYVTENVDDVGATMFRVVGENLLSATLSNVHKIEHSQEQGAFRPVWDVHRFVTPEGDCSQQSIDLSGDISEDGTLKASLPDGMWRIYRFGASLTGKVNHPASPEATGLEIDKMDPDVWRRYFDTYLGMYRDAAGGRMGRNGIQRLLVDSYEAGSQTWTPRMPEQFLTRRGYDLLPWLPVLAGEVIGSADESERFLWDWRTTIGELYEENYLSVAQIAREHGLRGCYMESHEGGRAFCGDGMEAKRNADIPMSAIWVEDTPAGSPIPQAIADIKESASVAHLYGKSIVAAESFTVEGSQRKAYTYVPENLKRTADIGLSAGLNRFVIHESAAQPDDGYLPGLGLFRYGQWFQRNETWAEYARPWMDYLARSCCLLQKGNAVADILLYYGEDSNATALYGGYRYSDLPDIPQGYGYDFANPHVLLNCIREDKGKMVTDSGMSYSILMLGRDCGTMSTRILKRIKELCDAGVTICGEEPVRVASLTDDPAEFNGLVQDIWHSGRKNVTESIDTATSISHTEPDFMCGIPDIRYVHRHDSKHDIYWVGNFSRENAGTHAIFRDSRRYAYIFKADDGSCTDITPLVKTDNGGKAIVPLKMRNNDAFFILFSRTPIKGAEPYKDYSCKGRRVLDGEWTVDFAQKGGQRVQKTFTDLHSWTEEEDQTVKFFSGTARYSTELDVSSDELSDGSELRIDLGRVRDLAEVKINGTTAGILWKAPFMTEDIRSLLHEGTNTLEVDVTNVWVNRMIGDKRLWGMEGVVPSAASGSDNSPATEHPQSSETGRVTKVTRFYKAGDPLLESGLMGPVELLSYTSCMAEARENI